MDAVEHLEFVEDVEVGRLVDEHPDAAGEGLVECLPRERLALSLRGRSISSTTSILWTLWRKWRFYG
jgi:hypothetical protein